MSILAKKKLGFISFVLVLAIIIGLFSGIPLVAFGLEYSEGDIWIGTDGEVMSEEHASQWEYTKINSDTEINLSKYKGSYTENGEIVGAVPATINGLQVTSLRSTFENDTNIKIAPQLPDTITSMDYTFYKAPNIQGEIFITESVTSLTWIFNNTAKPIVMKYSQFNMKAHNATVPNNVTKEVVVIEDTSADSDWIGADGNNMSLNETKLWTLHNILYNYNLVYNGPIIEGRIVGQIPAKIGGKQVTHLGKSGDTYYSSFYGNKELVHAPTIPDGVKVIGKMYEDNTSLTGDIYIPDSVESATDLFKGTAKPITVYFNNSVTVGSSIANNVALEVFPDNVTKVSTDTDVWIGTDGKVMSPEHKGQWAYRYQNDSSIRLGKYTGKYTEDGRIVGSVPATINGIPIVYLDGVFNRDKNIKIAPELPDTITSIRSTFADATNLQKFPSRLPNVDSMSYAFSGCNSLTGDIFIPDSANKWNSLDNAFLGTSKSITMFYSNSNTAVANVLVPPNVTKIGIASQQDFENSKPVGSEPEDGRVNVSVSTLNNEYSVEVGETLQFQATVNRNDLQYKWVVQDLFDINGQDGHFATINSNGTLTGIDAGYAIVGLMVKFEDGSEHAYGLTLVEVTSGGQTGYSGDDYYTIPGSYVGGWNYSYGYSGSLGSWFDATSGGLTLDGSSGGDGTGGEGGSTAPYPNESNAVTRQDTQSYEPSTTVSGSLFDKSKNYLKVGNSTQIDVINLNPDSINYKLVSKSLTSTPSVLINQDGLAVGNYEGVSLILLIDGDNKIIDTMLIIVGDTENIDGAGLEELSNASDDPNDYGFVTEVLNNSPNAQNIEIIGLVEPINTLNVVVPLNINFTIDANRQFIAPTDVKIVSNSPAPLRVSVRNVEKGLNAPDLVIEDTFTDQEWNNLSRRQTSENIALSLNGRSLAVVGSEIGTLKSGFREPTELDINITGKYGKAWDNKSNMVFTYSLVLLVEMQ